MQQTIQRAEKKTFSVSVWILACIEIFSAWQMGIIYYSSKAFTVNGVTPLPVNIDNTILAIVAAYLLGALFAFLFPRRAAFAGRLILSVSLLCTIAMFLPLPDGILAAAFYASVFFCVLFISVDAVLIVCLYSSKTAIMAAVCSGSAVAVFTPLLQNDLYAVDFRAFNLFALIVQMIVLFGVCRLPNKLPVAFLARQKDWAEKRQNRPPTFLLYGTLLLYFAACICTLFCSTMAESLPNGIAVAYLGCGVGVLCFFLFYRCGANPFHLTTALLAVVALGFLLFLLPYRPLQYAGLVLQGTGLFLSALSWFFTGLCFEKWRSRVYAPLTVLLALFAVMVNAGLMELLRSRTGELYLVYVVAAVALLLLYFLVKPFYERAYFAASESEPEMSGKEQEEAMEETARESTAEKAAAEALAAVEQPCAVLLALLTRREAEIADLISFGYSNGDIAGMLFLSDQTVKSHTKNIYRKLEIHSRFELAALINRSRQV